MESRGLRGLEGIFSPLTHSPNDSWWWWWRRGRVYESTQSCRQDECVCVQFLAHRVHNFYHILRHSGFPKTGQALAVLGRISLKWEPVPGPLRQGWREVKVEGYKLPKCSSRNKICKTSKKQQNHWRKNFSVFGEESLDDQGAPPSLLITYPSSHPAIHPSCHPPIIHSSIQISHWASALSKILAIQAAGARRAARIAQADRWLDKLTHLVLDQGVTY